MNCEFCNIQMKLRKFDCIDGLQWECTVLGCRKRYSVRKYSIFDNSKLELGLIFSILYNFANKVRADTTARTYGVGLKTVQKWYREFRKKLFFIMKLKKNLFKLVEIMLL
jgi:transposase-like protein